MSNTDLPSLPPTLAGAADVRAPAFGLAPGWASDCGRVVLHCADCRDVLPTLAGVDAVITDPPYGVNLGTHGAAKDRRTNRVLVKDGYGEYDDTPENYELVVVPAIRLALTVSKRALVFCAMPQGWKLPIPDAMGGVFLPSGCGRNKWGFNCLAHYLLYGSAPALNLGAKPTSFESTATAEHKDHPCPKPIPWMVRAVNLASVEGETVCDPFMGSGTTAIACIRTGRRFVGIERDPKYFAVALERIQREMAQGLLFDSPNDADQPRPANGGTQT